MYGLAKGIRVPKMVRSQKFGRWAGTAILTVAAAASVLAPLTAVRASGPDDWRDKDKHEEKRENKDQRKSDKDREKLAQDRARYSRDDRDGDKGRRGNGPPAWAVAAGRRDRDNRDNRRDNSRRDDSQNRNRNDDRYRSNDRDNNNDRYSDNQTSSNTHQQSNKNLWRNLGYASAAAAIYGALKHDNTITFAGLAGTLYSASRYEQDRKSQSTDSRARVALFDQGWFERDGVRYNRHETTRDGQKYYYFSR